MYRLYCDNQLLYHSNLESLQILPPALELERNRAGKLTFGVPASHPRYGLIQRMKSIITLYQGDYLLFRGRVLDEESGWYNEKKVTCEGDLAFLLDSVQRPFSFSGTLAEFLAYVLQLHNAQVGAEKHFLPGQVTAGGTVDYNTTDRKSVV